MLRLAFLVTLATALTSNARESVFAKRDVTSCSAASQLTSCQTSQNVDASSAASCCYQGALSNGDQQVGVILSVQDWDIDYGPSDSTGIHGLWGDYCGNSDSYPASCSSESGIPTATGSHITSVLQENDPDTLNVMNTYWLNDDGTNEELWSHEWNKHGTCYNTLRAQCFNPPSGISAADYALLSFFQQAVSLFQSLPTYQWLQNASISPSNDQTYQLSDVQSALNNAFGSNVYVGCDDNNNLNSFEYYFNIQGPLVNGSYYGIDATESSNCGSTVSFPPKST